MGDGFSRLIILHQAYCWRLRFGTKFIALLDIIFGIVAVALTLLVLAMPDKTKFLGAANPLYIILLFGASIIVGTSVALLIGIIYRRRFCFIPYLIGNPVSLILSFIALALAAPEVPVYLVVLSAVFDVTAFYHWILVLSYFGKLTDQEICDELSTEEEEERYEEEEDEKDARDGKGDRREMCVKS